MLSDMQLSDVALSAYSHFKGHNLTLASRLLSRITITYIYDVEFQMYLCIISFTRIYTTYIDNWEFQMHFVISITYN